MSEQHLIHPSDQPESAAQQVLLEMCKAGVFGAGSLQNASSPQAGERLGEAAVAFHKKLTEYYRTLGHAE
ncbi:hypothetical protein [Halomonas llamarensis]|uniref:Uncharacterized protein n=1 Tax=Halomonas llamarensis TaxID=2945104 RepID=A0ABT0SSJ0_9GAMM|nr:hypothetical protein [Halomonas llamarensis]MCL7930455.1 hypothetical protein [Halomonas llamarensis]